MALFRVIGFFSFKDKDYMSKRFRSNGEDIRVASLRGPVAIISKEFRELPESLWALAYAQGAISEDMTAAPSMEEYIAEKKMEAEQKEISEREEIKNILKSLYENPKDIINGQGMLIHRKAIQFIGKPVKKDVLDSIWSEVVEENSINGE